jgi:hypothetical protein
MRKEKLIKSREFFYSLKKVRKKVFLDGSGGDIFSNGVLRDVDEVFNKRRCK